MDSLAYLSLLVMLTATHQPGLSREAPTGFQPAHTNGTTAPKGWGGDSAPMGGLRVTLGCLRP